LYVDAFSPGLIPQAVLATLTTFAAMLFSYKTGLPRATDTFRRTLLIASVGYLLFALAHVLGVAVGAWTSIYFGTGSSVLGVGMSLFGVVLAALYLVLDFDLINATARRSVPEQYAWRLALGLVVTLVWLYVEFLRLIAILHGRE
jgi:uncharacterized YccA/Bax inhibitor family protein